MNSKILQSSGNPEELSRTVKGIIISFSSVIILIASIYFHTSLSTDQVAAFADQVAQTVSAVGIAYGAIHTLYGLIMKIVHTVDSKLATPTA